MALDLQPPRLPKKTEKCVCHMGKFNIPGTKTSEDLIEY